MPVTDNQEGLPLVNPGYSFNLSLPSTETGLATPYPYTGDGYAQMLAEKRAAEQREERMWRQRYAESAFDNAAKSPAGAVGAFQIMPITYKDYLERGKGKPGDLTNPAYNRKVRDFVLGIIPRDLGSLWSKESPEEINLAKRYAAYNWGAGSLRSYLRKKQKEGVDIHNSLDWMAGLPKETRDYVNFIVFNQDVPDTSKVADLYKAERDKYNSMAFGGVLGRFNHSDIRSALDKMRQNGANKYDGKSEPTGQMMLIGEDGNPIDVLPGAVTTYNTLSDYNRRQIKKLARNDYANVGEKTREFDKDWQERVYNRAWNRADRAYQEQEGRKALKRAAIQELQTGVPTGAFNEYTKEGIEDMSPFAMGLVLSAAGPALGGLRTVGDMAKAAGKVAGVAGRGAAKGLEWIGEKAMPSALLKSPVWRGATARAFQAAAPYADAAALSYWSTLAGNTAYNAIRNKDWGTASASGAMTLLPLAPAAFNIVKDARNILNAPRVSPQKDIGSQIAYRIINDAGFDDLINSGLIRPNPEGPFSHPGIQGGTWFSLDAPVTSNRPTILPNGNKVSYRGNYIIEVGDKSPQFPKGITPGTEGLNYRLGAMEINPRDSFIRIRNRKTGKYISPKEYIAHSPYVSETLEAQRAVSEASPVVAQASAAKQAPYVIQDLGGGYMLKSLMRGNPLEKQISKNGTVSVNNVKALINKGSNVEKAVVDKVLASEEFAGKKAIDYNKFRKAVQDELITYERTPDTRWEDYGAGNLGYLRDTDIYRKRQQIIDNFVRDHYDVDVYYGPGTNNDGTSVIFGDGNPEDLTMAEIIERFQQKDPAWFSGQIIPDESARTINTNTYTFSSPRIPNGSAKHYDSNTLGHSRTYTTAEEPDVLHVMESQSDWGQGYKKMNLDGEYNQKRINSLERRINNLKESINSETEGLRTKKMNDGSDMSPWFADSLRKQIEKDKQLLAELTVELDMRRNPKSATQQDYLAENFTSRQIQENLRYAAEKGQTKMRYPTRETAAKIEGYPKREAYFDESGKDVTKEKVYTIGEDNEKELKEIEKHIKDYSDKFDIVELPNGDIAPAGWLSDAQYFQYAQAVSRKRAVWEAYHANHPNATAGGEKIQLMEERLKKMTEERQKIKYWNEKRKQLKKMEPKLKPGITKKTVYDYEDILRKYADFPKQYKKLYKNADVRTVTDPKGNTWYEVDVPENYLKQEWAYADGGLLNKLSTHYGGDTAKIRELISKVKAKQLA